MNIARFYAASIGGGMLLGDLGIIGGTGIVLKSIFGDAPEAAPPNVTNLSPKIQNQMTTRGWTKAEIQQTYETGVRTKVVDKTAGGQPATQYLDKATGKFIVVNDATGNVIQVSGPGFRPNPPAK
jgi:hypothetical protein